MFGLFMVFNTMNYYRMGLIEKGLLAPKVLFKYDGFEWLHPLSQPAMLAVLALSGISAMLMAAGVLFRWACWGFALSLSFIFFQEKSYYNNHIYLFILLAVLLSFTHADRFLSLRSKNTPLWKGAGLPAVWKEAGGQNVPRWQQFILQAQIVIVYFFGGVAKMKGDWLIRKEPATSMVNFLSESHWLAPFFKNDFTVNVLTYGGFLLDILAPLLLLYKPFRRWALIPFVLFHLANSLIFDDIGIFPFVMLAAMILFYETHELPLLRRLVASGKSIESAALPPTSTLARNFLVAYFIFQLLFPLRGFFLPNQLDYTTIGNRFSWRMKADTRQIEEMKFFLQHPVSKQELPVNIQTFVNEMHISAMAQDPRAVMAFARMLQEEALKQGMPQMLVKARIQIRYNGRPPQYFVNPDVDLASVTYSPFRKLEWVVPLSE
jgi:hypothetical protein